MQPVSMGAIFLTRPPSLHRQAQPMSGSTADQSGGSSPELQCAPPRSPPTPLAGGRSRLPAKKRPRLSQALGGRLRAATRPHAVATPISLAEAGRLGLAEAALASPAASEATPTSGSCSPSLRATSASGDRVAATPEQQASCSQLQQAAHISSHSHIHTPTPTPTPTPLLTHTPTRARTHTHAHTGERRLGEA